MEMIQIDDNNYVTPEALQTAADEGRIAEPYLKALQRQHVKETAQDIFTGVCSGLGEAVTTVAGNVKLEVRTALFDMWHGTNYRQVRRAIREEERRRAFEASIGLTRKS